MAYKDFVKFARFANETLCGGYSRTEVEDNAETYFGEYVYSVTHMDYVSETLSYLLELVEPAAMPRDVAKVYAAMVQVVYR